MITLDLDLSMSHQARILFIDAYDSFSENIVALLRRQLNASVTVIKIDADPVVWKREDFKSFWGSYSAIILGPGPGNPTNENDIGLFNLAWKAAEHNRIPILGICLGFQSLCSTFGLPISRLDVPCHGHAKRIYHSNDDIFFEVGEVVASSYNSLGVRLIDSPSKTPDISRPLSSASSQSSTSSHASLISLGHPNGTVDSIASVTIDNNNLFSILAHDDGGYIMAVRHNTLPFWGLQFHPESCKSNSACEKVIQLWWEKVQAHNTKARPNIRQADTLPIPSTFVHSFTAGSQTSSPIISRMQLLMGSVGKAVCSQKLHRTWNRRTIADFCYSASPSGSVAMLESSKRGRYSIFALPDASTWHLRYGKGIFSLAMAGTVLEEDAMTLQQAMKTVEDSLSSKIIMDGDPDSLFWGGLIGFFSYEAGLDLLDVCNQDQFQGRSVPEFSLIWVDRSIVVDHQENTTVVQSVRLHDESWIKEMVNRMTSFASHLATITASAPPYTRSDPTTKPTSLPSRSTYISRIRSCQSSLHAGDSYELCLTTSAALTTPTSPYTLYTSLQQTNPAPYSAYLHLRDTHILSSSPEQFLSWSRHSQQLDMMPMKGTLAKSPSVNTIEKARSILLNPKEEAENLMIVDLIRHDLFSALGEGGRVEVMKLFEVVETESLYQLISHIRGYIPSPTYPPTSILSHSNSLPVSDSVLPAQQIWHAAHRALRHALPAGSMTGAPKKRSCEILRGLEQRNRGVYSGVIGYFDIGGGGCWSVAIRCAFSQDQSDVYKEEGTEPGQESRNETAAGEKTWHIGAGGAITVLSDEQAEWEEMKAKMSSVLKGFGVRM